MKSLVRCLYMVCWRNRLLIPLIITCASFAMLITLFYNRNFNDIVERRDGIMPHRYASPKVDPAQKRSLENSLNKLLKTQKDAKNVQKVYLDPKFSSKKNRNETAVQRINPFSDAQIIEHDDEVKSHKIKGAEVKDVHWNELPVHGHGSDLAAQDKQNPHLLKGHNKQGVTAKQENVKHFMVQLPAKILSGGQEEKQNQHKQSNGQSNLQKKEQDGRLRDDPVHHLSDAEDPRTLLPGLESKQPQQESPSSNKPRDSGVNNHEGKNQNSMKSAIDLGPIAGAKYNHKKYDHYLDVKAPVFEDARDNDILNRPSVLFGKEDFSSSQDSFVNLMELPTENGHQQQNMGDHALKFHPHDLKKDDGLPALSELSQGKVMPDNKNEMNQLRMKTELPKPGQSLHGKDIQNQLPLDRIPDKPQQPDNSQQRDINNFREQKGNVVKQKHAEFAKKAAQKYKAVQVDQSNLQLQTSSNDTADADIRPSRFRSDSFIPKRQKTIYHQGKSLPEELIHWLNEGEHICQGHLLAFHNEFALAKGIIIDTSYASGRPGGEDISDVINQPEEDEYYQFAPGFLKLPCGERPYFMFNNNNHLNQWLFTLQSLKDDKPIPVNEVRTQFTIAITRYEYANIYHTMTDFYNAFVLMELFNKTQSETNILIVDGHPKGALDSVWETLFNSSQRLSQLPELTKYTELVWGILGYDSLMLEHFSLNLPLIDEFRNFFLQTYQIEDSHKLNCDRLSIVFIWRRDYVAHPRNPSGSISRKIKNEQQLVKTLRQKFPQHNIKGVQIDLFEMRQQLQFIANADILIGMHGAGLTHTLFLPKHAALIELVPVYWSAASEHFQAIAQWRNLYYQRWTNSDPGNEAANYYTNVPPRVLNAMVKQTANEICTPGGRKITPNIFQNNLQ